MTVVIAVTTLDVVASPTPAAPPADGEPFVAGDEADDQTEEKALHDAGDDVADEQTIDGGLGEDGTEIDRECPSGNERGTGQRGDVADHDEARHE